MSESGIPIYTLFIHPNDLKDLKSDIWSDDPVPAVLSVDKKKYHVDIVYRGSHTRKFRKKSYHIAAYKPKYINGSKEFHLNAEYRDPSLLRNKLSFDFFSSIGVLSPDAQHVFVTINGRPEGIFLQLESVDEQFFNKRNYLEGSIFYAVDGDANFSLMSDLDKEVKKSLDLGYELKYGKQEDVTHLEDFIFHINTLSIEDFKHKIHDFLNVPQYLRWLAGVILTQNYDGFVHNYALYRNNQIGQFEIIPWDYDGTWGRDVNGKVMEYDYVGIEGFNTLTARLLSVDTYRKQYRDLLEAILLHQFTVENLEPKIYYLYKLLRPYILKDSYEKEYIDEFDQEPSFILQYIKDRRKYIYDHLEILR